MTIDPEILHALVELFDISPDKLEVMAGGHFTHVYECSRSNQPCVIRILDKYWNKGDEPPAGF